MAAHGGIAAGAERAMLGAGSRRAVLEGNMTLHLIKLCVGCESIEDLASWQKERLGERRKAGEKRPQLFHRTFQMPKRRDELLAGGSLYWVIKGLVACRQPLLGIKPFTDKDGIGRCHLLLDPVVIPVEPRPSRPFQGWRYLASRDAPRDLKAGRGLAKMPEELRQELAQLGLI
jgi:hypothetical protein